MGKKKPTWTKADAILPLMAIAFAVYYIYTLQGLNKKVQMYGGFLSMMVLLLGSTILLMVFIKKQPSSESITDLVKSSFNKYRKAFGLIGLTIVFIIVIPFLGYPLTSLFFVGSASCFLGIRKPASLAAISVSVTMIGFFLFVVFLRVPLPLDAVSSMVRRLF